MTVVPPFGLFLGSRRRTELPALVLQPGTLGMRASMIGQVISRYSHSKETNYMISDPTKVPSFMLQHLFRGRKVLARREARTNHVNWIWTASLSSS